MSRRPNTDLDALTVPKSEVQTAAAPQPVATKGYAHTLSLRLTADQYRRLRRFVAREEERTGQRLTHQALIETAISDWLDKHGG
jgi:hypothetical protein